MTYVHEGFDITMIGTLSYSLPQHLHEHILFHVPNHPSMSC